MFCGAIPLAADTVRIDPLQPGVIASLDGVDVFQSPSGGSYLGLADGEYQVDADTDLLLHFNSDGLRPLPRENYEILATDLIIQDQLKALGSAAALFTERSSGLVLSPEDGSMFQPGTHVGAFTLEFWFYSGAPREGGTILSWQGSSWLGNEPLLQEMSVRIVNRRMLWEFKNFFVRGDETSTDTGFIGIFVGLEQRRDLVPRRWSHHMLRYDPRRNVLEYLVDGITEAVTYVTDNRRESGTPFTPYVGELSEPAISIGQELNGALDELRLSRRWVGEVFRRGVRQTAGEVIFQRVDLLYPGARLNAIHLEHLSPGLSEVRLSWFLSDLIETPESWDARWLAVEEISSLRTEMGRYLYMKAELLPDGVEGNRPGIESITVDYLPDPPPPAPTGLTVQAIQGGVRLNWTQVIRGNLTGYKVYFGTRPDEYFGESHILGPSPVDAGRETAFEITGLEPGRVYYFRVASYNYSNDPIRGAHIPMRFSDEVAARPLR